MFAAGSAQRKEAGTEIDLDHFSDGLFILQFYQHLRFDQGLLKMAVDEAPDAARAGKEDEGHLSQLGPLDSLSPSQGVEFADGDHEFLREKPLVADVPFRRKAFRRFTHQTKIQVPGLEFLNQLVRGSGDQVDVHARVLGAEALDHRRQEKHERGRPGPDPQPPAHEHLHVLDLQLHIGDLPFDRTRQIDQAMPGFGELDGSARPHKDSVAKLLFEHADLAVNSRMGDVKMLSRPDISVHFSDREQHFELPDFHAPP